MTDNSSATDWFWNVPSQVVVGTGTVESWIIVGEVLGLWGLIHCFSCCCDQIPNKSNLRKGGSIWNNSVRIWSIMLGKGWELEREEYCCLV